jgi:hypothetical protein
MTGQPHRLFWMRSALWCEDCRQKIEGCCEGGGCPSVAEVLPSAEARGAGSPGWHAPSRDDLTDRAAVKGAERPTPAGG